jgi:hypothetical protein
MTEIGAERRDMMGNGLAVVGTGLERSDGESVTIIPNSELPPLD